MKYLIITLVLITPHLHAQITLENFNTIFRENPKPIVLYFSTKWCSYCMIQKKQVEKDNELLFILNKDFYYIEIDAETNKKITFLDYDFNPISSSKTHPFIEEFNPNNKQISYPYWVLISKDLDIKMTYAGLIKAKNLKTLLKKYLTDLQ